MRINFLEGEMKNQALLINIMESRYKAKLYCWDQCPASKKNEKKYGDH